MDHVSLKSSNSIMFLVPLTLTACEFGALPPTSRSNSVFLLLILHISNATKHF